VTWNYTITTDALTGPAPEVRSSIWTQDAERWGSWSNVVPSGARSAAGVNITPESALTLTAALACINVIATDFSYPPCKVYRRRPGGGRDEVRDTAIWERLNVSPDGETTPMRSRQALMGHTLGHGNGYYEIETNGGGEIVGLHLLDPRTRPERRPQDNRLFYRLPNNKTLPPARVFHLAGLGFDGLCGYSPVKLASDALALGKAAELFGAGFYGNNSQPGGLIKTTAAVKPEALARFRAGWEGMHRGAGNNSRIAFLEQGWDFVPTTISPEDAQFLEGRKFQVLEVARIYRVPPHKIGDYSQSHLANIEASNLDYVITVLTPWCEAFEQEANLKLLTADERKAGFYIEHQLTALLRGDMRSRAEFYTKLRDLGALSPNEVRDSENLNPIEGGDLYLVPMNMVSLEHAGEPPEPATGTMPNDSPDDETDPEPEPTTNGRASILANGHAAN
jgi:HK97 family phage portal protein